MGGRWGRGAERRRITMASQPAAGLAASVLREGVGVHDTGRSRGSRVAVSSGLCSSEDESTGMLHGAAAEAGEATDHGAMGADGTAEDGGAGEAAARGAAEDGGTGEATAQGADEALRG